MDSHLYNSILYIAHGILTTLGLTSIALVIGIILGVLMAISRFHGFLQLPIIIFISIIRGTPILLQLSFFYFVLPTLIPLQITAFSAGFLTLGINSSAYIAEIFRGGIESIPKGQFEVSEALHIPLLYQWKDIILPQVMKTVFPVFISEVTVLLKETALISMLGELDIMRRAQLIAAKDFDYFTPLLIAGVLYYILIMCVEQIGTFLEKRMLRCSK